MTRIVLTGGTGLIGSAAIPEIAAIGHELHVIGRREIEVLPQGVTQHVALPAEWPAIVQRISADIAVSTLGSTIKKAGSQKAFRTIDFELIRDFATAAKSAGAKQCIVVSSTMANSRASNFYLKTKGEAEDALRDLKFDRLDLLRPGLLKGERAEFRLGESVGIMLSPMVDLLLHGPLRRYRSIDAATVACAIANLAGKAEKGVFIHENDEICAVATKASE